MTHILAFQTRRPANGPVWLPDYDRSVVDLFRRMMPGPFTLHGYGAAELPDAADHGHSIAFDHDEGVVVMSDGADWKYFSFSDHIHAIADVTGLQAALDAKLDDSQATAFGLSLLGDANAAAGRNRLGLGTAAVKNIGTSGDAVPLLNASNLWSGTNLFVGGLAGSGSQPFRLNPSDFGSGKPALIVEQAPTNGMRISLYDGSYAGALYFRATNYVFASGTTAIFSISSTGHDVAGEARCDTLRIDASPTAAVVSQSHHVPININGTDYKLLLAS